MCGIERMLHRSQCLIVVFIVLLQGCVPVFLRHYYISLEDIPEIQVLEYGTYDYGPFFFNDDMPTKYVLSREKYIIYFDITKSGIVITGLFIYSVSHDGSSLVIKTKKITGNCGGFFPSYNMREASSRNPNAVPYLWGVYRQYCNPKKEDILRNYEEIVFDVVDEEGNVLGSESLSYDLIRNGVYITYDAL